MIQWMKFFLELCFLKAAPQDAPSSRLVLYFAILAYFVVGAAITMQTQAFASAVTISAIQTILIIFLTNLILWIRKTPERFIQAVTSLMGSGSLIGLVAIPVLGLVLGAGGEESIASMLWIVLIVWETVVVGHVLRHTMDLPFIAGLGAALVYMYMSFAITLRILKVLAIPVN